jgi:hypothetical protein
MPRLILCGAMLHSSYAFMVCTGTTLPLSLPLFSAHNKVRRLCSTQGKVICQKQYVLFAECERNSKVTITGWKTVSAYEMSPVYDLQFSGKY